MVLGLGFCVRVNYRLVRVRVRVSVRVKIKVRVRLAAAFYTTASAQVSSAVRILPVFATQVMTFSLSCGVAVRRFYMK